MQRSAVVPYEDWHMSPHFQFMMVIKNKRRLLQPGGRRRAVNQGQGGNVIPHRSGDGTQSPEILLTI